MVIKRKTGVVKKNQISAFFFPSKKRHTVEDFLINLKKYTVKSLQSSRFSEFFVGGKDDKKKEDEALKGNMSRR